MEIVLGAPNHGDKDINKGEQQVRSENGGAHIGTEGETPVEKGMTQQGWGGYASCK